MEIVAFSSPGEYPNEVEEAIKMLDMGILHFHIRKPKYNRKEMARFVTSFPEAYRKQLILHSHHGLVGKYKLGGMHLSRIHRKRKTLYKLKLWLKLRLNRGLVITRTFHKLTDVNDDRRAYSYAFLSPVFDRMSQNSIGGGYSKRALLIMIPQARQPIYALGGIGPSKIALTKELGFQGAVLLGALWKGNEAPHVIAAQTLLEAGEMNED